MAYNQANELPVIEPTHGGKVNCACGHAFSPAGTCDGVCRQNHTLTNGKVRCTAAYPYKPREVKKNKRDERRERQDD